MGGIGPWRSACFLLTAIRENWPIPPGFDTSRKRELQARVRLRENRPEAVAEAQRARLLSVNGVNCVNATNP